jgi:phytoene synthase
VCDGVHGRLRYELRLTWLGAVRVLDRLEATGFDVFNKRPALVPADAPALVRKLLTWRRT